MGSFGKPCLSQVFKMLEHCAQGFKVELKLHHYWVHFNDKTYRRLPKGAHGETDPEIEKGHIRKLIRHLGIDPNCAAQFLPLK